MNRYNGNTIVTYSHYEEISYFIFKRCVNNFLQISLNTHINAFINFKVKHTDIQFNMLLFKLLFIYADEAMSLALAFLHLAVYIRF